MSVPAMVINIIIEKSVTLQNTEQEQARQPPAQARGLRQAPSSPAHCGADWLPQTDLKGF